MDSSTQYNPASIESKWYNHWLANDYFSSKVDDREPFSIVIPPPNVTGVLHMGHMLNNTIQDILIRKARLDGKNACWVPGTDHASIATEAKVVRALREKGIKKSDLTREQFLQEAWKWKEEYGGIILKQLRKLGASCDWKRTAFTMDEVRSDGVIKAFVDLYNRGKLYRGLRMVNWDPEAKTVLSNEEVIYQNENANLYFIKYFVEGSDEFLTVATTRPETLMGDTAVAVHPDDPRYAHLKGKKVIVPLVNRVVPIIQDDYVDMEFGTGALKVTPAHDTNDYEIGKRHNLEVIDILNDDGTLAAAAEIHVGQDRFEARKLVKIDLSNADLLIKIEQYQHNVGRSERTNAVVEPKLSLQWYVDMPSLAKPALEAVMSDDVAFFPKNQKNLYRHWMENIKDWCISRQLWWGHRIPAWYLGEHVFVATTAEEALEQARVKTSDPSLQLNDLRQDEDVLDTWFSSWLWPITVFDGFNPDSKDFAYYYPTSVLVTGWDIIFLWVARMVMAGFEWKGERPYKHVYFTGMVRDNQRRKMSKSLGNSPDALALIDQFGADGVRFGMLSSSPAGGDLLFDEKLCEQGRNFSNKIWNALRLVSGWQTEDSLHPSETDQLAIQWMKERTSEVLQQIQQDFDQYRLSEALTTLYTYIWSDFCSWYLEMIKPEQGQHIAAQTLQATTDIFENICIMLHPFMPFLTEEVWHSLKDRKSGEDCIISQWPTFGSIDHDLLKRFEQAQQLVTDVRATRNKHGLKMREAYELASLRSSSAEALLEVKGMPAMICKMASLSSIHLTDSENIDGLVFISGADKYILKAELEVDVAEELEAKQKELEYQQGFVQSVMKKLGNERFVAGAPAAVVENERKKLADGEQRIALLTEEIKRLEGKG